VSAARPGIVASEGRAEREEERTEIFGGDLMSNFTVKNIRICIYTDLYFFGVGQQGQHIIQKRGSE
jgi:hypothetical protein